MGMLRGNSPGSRETKTVGVATEVIIPLQQVFMIILLDFMLYCAAFWFITRVIVSKGDWLILLSVLHVIASIFGLRKLSERVQILPRSQDLLDGLVKVVILALLVMLAGWYYDNVIVYMADVAANDHFTLLVLGLLVSCAHAAIKGNVFYTRQLTDTLRDSDSHYAIESLKLEHADREASRNRREEFYVEDDDEPEITPEVRKPLLVGKAPNVKLKDAQTLYNTAVFEFLDALKDGRVSTSETSWDKVKLPQSGYLASSIGDTVRDFLIAGGWAEWNHPTEKKQGWKLKEGYDIEYIKKHIFDGSVKDLLDGAE